MTDGFVNRGIKNSQADIWAHLFPRKYTLYWYRVRHMREHIKDDKPPITPGYSKNGIVTGRGYLVRNDLPFISAYQIPEKYIDHFDWENITDRQVGMLQGERVLDWWLNCGRVQPGLWVAHPITTRSGQYDVGDFALEFRARPTVELKTEMKDTDNLYVQTAEHLHDVHTTKDGKRRVTQAPSLES